MHSYILLFIIFLISAAFSVSFDKFITNTPVRWLGDVPSVVIPALQSEEEACHSTVSVEYNTSHVTVHSECTHISGTLFSWSARELKRVFSSPPIRLSVTESRVLQTGVSESLLYIVTVLSGTGTTFIMGDVSVEQSDGLIRVSSKKFISYLNLRVDGYTDLPKLLERYKDCSSLLLDSVTSPCSVKKSITSKYRKRRQFSQGLQFDENPYEDSYPEDMPSGAPIMVVAVSADSSRTITYSLIRDTFGSSRFAINPTTGTIKLLTTLDYEDNTVINLPVLAESDTYEKTVTEVILNVEDTNDERPQFVRDEYLVSVLDRTPIGSEIGTVLAVDADSSLNGQVKYTLVQGADSINFNVDRESGSIRITTSLHHKAVYSFVVEACDRGAPPLKSNVTVRVFVQNTTIPGAVPPRFEQRSYSARISELGRAGHEVLRVRAAPPSPVQYSIIQGSTPPQNSPRCFDIDPYTGVITRLGMLDYDSGARVYYLLVKVRTTQLPAAEDYALVMIELDDVNDNVPIFSQSKYTASVLENVPSDTYITTVTATDQDSGTNGEITYSFGSGDTDGFRIDDVLGHIYTGGPLDRERTSFYNFYVLATDKGAVPQSAGSKVQVNVLDVNDCKPVFRSPIMEVYVGEDAQIGDLVTTLTSLDQDEGQNAAVTYTFISGDTAEFTLNPGTGIVRVNTDLDYETKQEYSIRVQATDGKFFDEAMLVIRLEDVNDHVPIFEREEYLLKIREDIAPGTALVQLKATDGDVGSDQSIRYLITSRDVPFSLNYVDGWLSVSTELDRETVPSYLIEITATDRGGLAAGVTVAVTIQDINDNSPACQPPFEGSVPENSPPGTAVLTVNATDRDTGDNALLSYRLLSHQDTFTMNSTTGEVTVQSPVDREVTDQVKLLVEVSDNGRSQRRVAECTFVIKVTDENDNAPIFSQLAYSVSLSELTSIGTVFFKLDCNDEDSGVNGELDYTIASGNSPPAFDINSRTGELKVIGSLNYELNPEYMLQISVTDRAEPYHESSTRVEIKVEDGNDNPPLFEKDNYLVDVAEDLKPGMTILSVIATDRDSNQTVSYMLQDSYNRTFTLDNQGDVVLMRALDREDADEYILSVTASDDGDPVLSSSTTITLTVVDVNDNPPLFLQSEYTLSTSIDTLPGTELLFLSVSDSDGSGNGPPFTLNIVSGNAKKAFGISNNVLKVLQPDSLSPGTVYTLQLRVSDSGSPPLTSTTLVVISVLTANNFPPVAAPLQINLPLFVDTDTSRTLHGHYTVTSRTLLGYSATDSDPGTVLVYSISGTDPEFWMFPNGTLMSVERPSVGTHRLTVFISDGKHKEISTITVQVYSLNSVAAANPLSIQLNGVTEHTFNKELFLSVIGDIFRTSSSEVVVLSAQEKTTKKRDVRKTLEVVLMARTHDEEYLSLNEMRKLLSRDIVLFQDRTGYIVESMDLDPCLREPCPLSSTCTSTTSYTLVNNKVTPSTTSTCLCGGGMSGYRCDVKIPCYSNSCNTGVCLVVGQHSEKCSCDENWTGLHCEITVRHCLNSPCLNGGTCRDETVGYTCSCPNGYKGTNCETAILAEDLCTVNSPCSRHSTCTSGADDVTCTCDEGWAGRYCTYGTEESEERPCSRNPCQHSAQCTSVGTGRYECTCTMGFTGPHCEENIDECRRAPCVNGGTCTDGIDGYICSCARGYSGTNCQHTAQPCDDTPCLNGGFCYNLPSEKYLCQCARGYIGDTCDIPLVSPGYCDVSPCTEHADTCTAGLLGYTCTCSLRWRGKNCEIGDVSAGGCDLNPCYNGATCVSQPSSYIPYTCHCEPGFAGLNCEENVNECTRDTCLNGGTCIDRTNTYECVCVSGYSGRTCQITEEPCLSLPCRNSGKCYNLEEEYVCQCTASHTGRNCETQLTFCPESHCRNGGECGVTSEGSVRCSCKSEYHGEYCQYRYRYCTPHTCLHEGTCIEGREGYRCDCTAHHTGPECQVTEVGVLEGGHVAVTAPPLKYSTISFKMRTRSNSGILLYVGRYGGGRDYLIVHLVNERVVVRFSVGGDQPATLQLNKRVSDRRWHMLTISINSKQVSAVLDECHDTPVTSCFASSTVSGAYYSLDTNTALYLGGVDHNYPFLPESLYHGCIKDLYIDDVLVDLSNTVSSARSTVGCMEHDCGTACSGQNVCVTSGGVVTCQCPWGRRGDDCSTTSPSVTLSKGAPLALPVTSSYLNPSTLMISLQIRTRIPDCLIIVFGSPGEQQDYVILGLTDGQPTVTLNTGKPTTLTLFGGRANDGSWHTILFNKVLDQIELKLDDAHFGVNRTSDGHTQFRTDSRAVLSTGGVSGGLVVRERVGAGVIGCIRDVRVSNRDVDLLSSGVEGVRRLGCEAAPTCVHSTCPPTHRCTDIWGDYSCSCPTGLSGPECNCPAGYTGDKCQYEIDECYPDPCRHATDCQDLLNDYHCTCRPGYAGKNCDVDINECAGLPCGNGGMCADMVDGFECRCAFRYTGPLCEIDTTPCVDEPCLHQGTCTEYGAGQYGCQCSTSWGGQLCQLPRSCSFAPCVHGRCRGPGAGETYVTCECEKNWAGPTCNEVDCSTCEHGECGEGVCACHVGYSGPTCQEEEYQVRVTEPIQTWVIVLVVVLGALLLTVILLIVVFRKKCYRATKYREIPLAGGGTPGGGGTPLHPYYHPPVQSPHFYPDKLQYNMFQYRQYPAGPGNMVQMSELSHSTATLDNEIKL